MIRIMGVTYNEGKAAGLKPNPATSRWESWSSSRSQIFDSLTVGDRALLGRPLRRAGGGNSASFVPLRLRRVFAIA